MLLLLVACGKVEPAPKDLDEIFHFLWLHAEDEEEAPLVESFSDLDIAVEGSTLEEPIKGSITDLSAEEVAVVELDVDPEPAAGLFFVNPVVCDLDHMEKITYWQDQDELYPDYSEYNREYTSSLDDYLARTTNTLTWETTYTASNILSGEYSSKVIGSMRRFEDTEFGPVLLIRAWIPEPAVFVKDGPVFDLDFQMEIYYEGREGTLIHAYPIWRHLFIANGLSTDDAGFQATLLNELIDYDTSNEKFCEEGTP
jgi:hypothetical protein